MVDLATSNNLQYLLRDLYRNGIAFSTYTRLTLLCLPCAPAPRNNVRSLASIQTLSSFRPIDFSRVARNREQFGKCAMETGVHSSWTNGYDVWERSVASIPISSSLVLLAITWSTFAPFQSIKSRRGGRLRDAEFAIYEQHMPRSCPENWTPIDTVCHVSHAKARLIIPICRNIQKVVRRKQQIRSVIFVYDTNEPFDRSQNS